VAGPLSLRLNGTLEPDAYRPVFRSHRRLHIPSILEPTSATALYARLAASPDWTRSFHVEGGKDVDIRVDELDVLSPEQRAEFEQTQIGSSTDGVTYVFDSIRITAGLLDGRAGGKEFRMVQEFVNGPAFLDFMIRLTGDPRIAFADVMATRYLRGHFATAHEDAITGGRRLYAYVLNLTPQWWADWGGVLMFHDEDGHVAEGYVPKFNALNVFAVPQVHSVSMVSRLARDPRYSVTGWLHAAE